ncbi:hypothetical protein RugamoR57_32770 [Duganella caerulea]|uniref:hypothetical protein n=1 Tax=Duganella caerulea TaxID=2885762 RepID=UPI0030EAB5CA
MKTMVIRMRGRSALSVILLIISAAIVASVGLCAFKSHSRNAAFDAVRVGDTEAAVIARFGAQPSVREKAGALFARYASQPCDGSCVERLWFENSLSLDTEAWSVALDKDRRVVGKSRWVSP